MPKAPDEASGAGEQDTMLKIIFAQAAKLVQVDSELTWEALTAGILEQCDLPSGTTSADLALSYVDSDGHMLKISKQEDLQKVAKYHRQQHQAPGAITLYLGLRDASRNGGGLVTTAAAEAASKEDFEAFRKPIDSFVEIDEKELEFRDRIGVGACGEVFHGKWRGVDVAVKCLFTDGGARHSADGAGGGRVDKELLKDFRNEVRLMMQLRHPNICLFMGAVFRLETQRLCIVSEFCHRGSLYRILHKSERQLPILRRCQIALDAAKGCQFLHTHKPCIVHRDLKSPNLLVDKHWNVKVGDFGLARTKSHFYVSLGGGNVGTPEWTAPEVLKDEQFTEKADVYSFGVVLWEICTRQRPFRGLTQMQVVVAVGFNGERLPRVSHWDNDSKKASIDPEMSELMQNCMADEWQTRPSFEDIVIQLSTICGRYQKREEQKASARRGRSQSAASEPAVVHKPASVVMAPTPAAAKTTVATAQATQIKATAGAGSAGGGASAKSGTTGTIISFLRRSGEEKELKHGEPEPEPGPGPGPEPERELQQ
jgi:serine/threonine protein kinase